MHQMRHLKSALAAAVTQDLQLLDASLGGRRVKLAQLLAQAASLSARCRDSLGSSVPNAVTRLAEVTGPGFRACLVGLAVGRLPERFLEGVLKW